MGRRAASRRVRERMRFGKGGGGRVCAWLLFFFFKLLDGFVFGTIISCLPAFARPPALWPKPEFKRIMVGRI